MPKAAIKQPSELDVARAQIAALAEKANTGAAFGMLEHILKTDCKADRQQVEFILTQERNRTLLNGVVIDYGNGRLRREPAG